MLEHGSLRQLKEIIGEICAVDPAAIGDDERLRGYGLDSLRTMDLMMSIEDEFRVQLRLEDLTRIQTVGQLAEYLDTLRAVVNRQPIDEAGERDLARRS